MAINPVPVQAVRKDSTTHQISIGAGDGWSTPTAGNIIVLLTSFRVDSATANAPTFAANGYAVPHSDYVGNAQARGAIAWKAAAGTESTIAIDAHSSDILNNWSMIAVELDGTDVDISALEVSNGTSTDTAGATSGPTGSATSAGNALCLSVLACVTHNAWDNGTSPTINNSYTKRTPTSDTNFNVGLWWATKSAAAGDQGATWSTTDTGDRVWAAVIVFAEDAAPAVTFDDTSYAPGETIVVTASPAFGGTINSFGVTGGDTFTVSGADTDSANVAVPAITEFVSGGSANNTRLGTSLTGTVGDGTDTATDTFTITPPAGYFLVTLAADYASLSASAQEWVPATAVTGDDLLVSATVGTIIDVTEYAEIAWDGLEGTARVVMYDVSGTAWSAATTPTFGPGYTFPTLVSDIPNVTVNAGGTRELDISTYFDGDFAEFTIVYSIAASDSGLPGGSSLDADTGMLTIVGPTDLESYPAVYSGVIARLTAVDVDPSDSNPFSITVYSTTASTPAIWVMQTTSIFAANDAWMSYLSAYEGSLNDRMYAWLGDEGYTGSLSDRVAAWSRNNLSPFV